MQYKFGPFMLDPNAMSITAAGRQVQCDDRMVMLLKLLAEHYPETCESQFLLTKLWPNRVVSASSLTKLISDSRAFFKEQKFLTPVIHTVHGRGYRLTHNIAQTEGFILGTHNTALDIVSAKPAKTKQLKLFFNGILGTFFFVSVILATKMLPFDTNAGLKIAEPDNIYFRVLWVDDHPKNNVDEVTYFKSQNIAVYQVTSSRDALALISMYNYQLIISDMGRHDNPVAGLHLAEEIRARGLTTPYIIYTIMPSSSQSDIARSYGVDAVVVDSASLYRTVQQFVIENPILNLMPIANQIQ